MTRGLNKFARANGLSEDVEELIEKKAKAISRVGEYRLTTYRDLLVGKPFISEVSRIDRLENAGATFGKVTDFTPTTIRTLIESGQIDARISIARNQIIFAIEDLVSDGIMSNRRRR